MNSKYKRVCCDLYDQLESYATLKKDLNISFSVGNGEAASAQSQIVDLTTTKEGEFIITKEGLTLRLDRIIKITPIQISS